MQESLVDQAALDELTAVIGTEKLGGILDRFVLSLATAFDGTDRAAADYGREAHTLVSMSGMLGCAAFSVACRGLEQAAKTGDDLTGSLIHLKTLRDRTVTALQELRMKAGNSV